MKIATLTVHNGYNFGASLQAFALVTALREMGLEAHLLDYRNENIENVARRQQTANWRDIRCLKKNLTVVARRVIGRSADNRMKNRYEQFHKSILDPFCGPVYSTSDFTEINRHYDGFVCGSDQIWNYKITGDDLAFFLNFADDNKLKMAYAASLGAPKLNYPVERIEQISHLLHRFDAVSVRESKNQDEVAVLSGQECQCVVDPVLLVDRQKWIEMANMSPVVVPKKPYALCYQVLQDPEFHGFAKQVAQKNGLPLIRMDWHPMKARMKGCQSVSNAGIGPLEFLKLFLNAEVIISNSFHGTVFSMLFNKKFVVHELVHNHAAKNVRIVELLRMVGLSDRMTRDPNCEINAHVDWQAVEARMKPQIGASRTFLKSALSNEK